jgi:RsiW-degrading membrane proteinase PrsW (M82 family)
MPPAAITPGIGMYQQPVMTETTTTAPGRTAFTRWLAQQAPKWYWRVFLLGLVAYILAMYQLNSDHNPHLVPLVLLLASALVPITFVIFCWEENTLADLPLTIVGVTFLIGASFSLFVADVLEGMFAIGTGVGQMVMVGVCEETAKALAVCWLLHNKRLRGEIHGLVLGAAAGMGFAALETAGYGFDHFVAGVVNALGPHATSTSAIKAGISSMTGVLVVRMVLAAFGHGVWTAIIGAAIWRDRGASTFKLTRGVALACGIAVTLHALWDTSPWLIPVSAIIGILVLRFLIGESIARAQRGPAAPSPEPLEQALLAYVRHRSHRGMASPLPYETTIFPRLPENSVQQAILAWAHRQGLDVQHITPTAVTALWTSRRKIGWGRAIGEWLLSIVLGCMAAFVAVAAVVALGGGDPDKAPALVQGIGFFLVILLAFGTPLADALCLLWRARRHTLTVEVCVRGPSDGVQITASHNSSDARTLVMSLVTTLI